jgi:hypothetical protein
MTGAFIFAISPSDERFAMLEHFPAKDEKPDGGIPQVLRESICAGARH